MPPGLVQQALRAGFRRWGRPRRLRVDNGSPWGSWSDLPPPLALWLIGLGIDLIWNPPRRPQHNGVVERSQGLAQSWAEPERCWSVAELQGRLDSEDRVQREEYPYCDGRSRGQTYPELSRPVRPYSVAWEQAHWDWSAVVGHLSGYAVARRVDRCGKVGLYHAKRYVGRVNRGRATVVQFDADEECWVVSTPEGQELCRRPLQEFDARRLRQL